MSKRAILYARVSTEDQADKGYSLPSQIEECKKYAEMHDFIVSFEITDEFSGMKLDRPGLDRVRELLRNREADVVIVLATDRLTRRLAHLLVLREEWQKADIELHFVRRGKSKDTPEDRMMENIEGVFNEYWREKIVEASRRALHNKAKNKKVVGGGQPPYGYRYENDDLIIVEREAKVVRKIYNWYITGDEHGNPLSIYEIAKRLSASHIPTPGEREKAKRPRKRGPCMWNTIIVHRILEKEVYAGTLHWGKSIGASSKDGKRPLSEQFSIPVTAIVTPEMWKAAAERAKYNSQISGRNAKRQYLLRGMITCGCGYSMTAHVKSWGGMYYRCASNYRYMPGIERRSCDEKSVRGEVLEAFVWDYVLELITDESKFRARLEQAQEERLKMIEPKQEELATVNELIERKETEAAKFAQVLVKSHGNAIQSALQAQIDRLEKEYTALKERQKELVSAIDAKQITDEEKDIALNFRRDVVDGLKDPTFEDKRRVLELLQTRIRVEGGQVQITLIGQKSGHSLGLHTSTSCLQCRRWSRTHGADV